MLDHPNGAEALTALWIAADDPAEVAARYARFTGRPAFPNGPMTTIDLDRGRLIVMRRQSSCGRPTGSSRRGNYPASSPPRCGWPSLATVKKCLDASALDHRFCHRVLVVDLPAALGERAGLPHRLKDATNYAAFTRGGATFVSNFYEGMISYRSGVN